MKKKVTTQDIADLLGISRNTVSKALNDHPGITAETKKLVLDKAIRLGYKKATHSSIYPTAYTPGHPVNRHIALLVRSDTDIYNSYWFNVMKGAEEVVRKSGHHMLLHFIQPEDLESLTFPHSIESQKVDGILMAGIQNPGFVESACMMDLPTVMIDGPSYGGNLKADLILMESRDNVHALTKHLIVYGHKDIRFMGDVSSCLSFRERWMGYRLALAEHGLTDNQHGVWTEPSPSYYQDYEEVRGLLAKEKELPTAIVCANDLVAVQVVRALAELGIRVPQDVSVTGFDGKEFRDYESLHPKLSTVKIDSGEIGKRAMEQLLRRMEQPALPYESVRLFSDVIIGESTGPAAR